MKGGVEGAEVCVMSSHTETLCCKIHCGKVSDEMRVNSKAPRAAVTQMFVCTRKAAASTK